MGPDPTRSVQDWGHLCLHARVRDSYLSQKSWTGWTGWSVVDGAHIDFMVQLGPPSKRFGPRQRSALFRRHRRGLLTPARLRGRSQCSQPWRRKASAARISCKRVRSCRATPTLASTSDVVMPSGATSKNFASASSHASGFCNSACSSRSSSCRSAATIHPGSPAASGLAGLSPQQRPAHCYPFDIHRPADYWPIAAATSCVIQKFLNV